MLDRVLASFSDPETRPLFAQNERVYDQYLSNFISNYAANSSSIAYFGEVNTTLRAYTKQSTKMCSKLKHLCYDFGDLMLKMSSSLDEIADHIGKMTAYTNEVYGQLKIAQSPEVIETDKRLQAGIAEWGRQIVTQRQHVLDNMASFFHFKKHEFLTFELLIESKLAVDEAFKRKYFELEAKKQKLFESKNVEKWRIRPTAVNEGLNDLLHDYAKAREHMIPEETKPVDTLGKLSLYLCKHVLFEFLNFYVSSHFFTKDNFGEFTQKMMRSYENPELIWSKFTQAGGGGSEAPVTNNIRSFIGVKKK